MNNKLLRLRLNYQIYLNIFNICILIVYIKIMRLYAKLNFNKIIWNFHNKALGTENLVNLQRFDSNYYSYYNPIAFVDFIIDLKKYIKPTYTGT